jgi:hypothetical protein
MPAGSVRFNAGVEADYLSFNAGGRGDHRRGGAASEARLVVRG